MAHSLARQSLVTAAQALLSVEPDATGRAVAQTGAQLLFVRVQLS